MSFTFSISSIFNKASRVRPKVIDPITGVVSESNDFVDGDLSDDAIDFCLEGNHTVAQLKSTETLGPLLTQGTITFGEILAMHQSVLSTYKADKHLLSCSEDKVFTLQYSNVDGKPSPIRNSKRKSNAEQICFISVRCSKDPSLAPTFS